jgi:dipeptidyl aminopeptidase/acylaminoacyl peptidase
MTNKILFSKPALSLTIAFAALLPINAVTARPMTETDLAMMKRLANPSASPDGKQVVYQLRETDLEANKGRIDLFLIAIDGSGASPLKIASKPNFNEHDPAFAPDGKTIYYISNESGSEQIWRASAPYNMSQQVSKFKADVAGFKLSPDGKKIAVWGDIASGCEEFGCEKDGDRSKPGPGSGREYDQLFVRHWDEWEAPGNYSRLFTYEISADGILTQGKAIDGELAGDVPSKPSGGGEEISWAADSKSVYFAKRIADKKEPLSTDLDIYQSPVVPGVSGTFIRTEDNSATDTMPAASPDGQYVAWAAMARPGYESDKLTLWLKKAGEAGQTALTANWDRSINSMVWAPDSKSLYVTANDTLDTPIFQIDLNGKVQRLTKDGHVSAVLPVGQGELVYALDSLQSPTDLYHRDANGKTRVLTQVNRAALAEIDAVSIKRFQYKGAGGDMVWGQIIKPAGSKERLPVAMLVHGGPQSSFGNSWSFRWNPKVMASQGFAAVTVDFHGSIGYGQAFTDSINQDWGGKPLEDIKLGMAELPKIDPALDTDYACALGGSYGGYMMNWIAGNWPDGFKCLVNHAGIFDLRAMAYETEELWFDQWDNGGNWVTRKGGEKWNPVNHVANWKTPTLFTAGEKDFRIPYTQSIAGFTAAQQQDVESKLLIFPDENHWILKPKNSIQWHAAVFQWLRRHTAWEAGD